MSIVDTVGVCGECLLGPTPVGSCHSLRQVIFFPRGVDPGLWVPQQSQALEAPSKMWAATPAYLQVGDSCDPSGQDCSSLLSSTSGSYTDFSTSWVRDWGDWLHLWQSQRHGLVFCESADWEVSHNNELLPSRRTRLFLGLPQLCHTRHLRVPSWQWTLVISLVPDPQSLNLFT